MPHPTLALLALCHLLPSEHGSGPGARIGCAGPGHGDTSICGLHDFVTIPSGVLLGTMVGAHDPTAWWLPAS